MMQKGCKMNEKMKLKRKTKTSFIKNATKHKEHEMLWMKEQDIVLGMTQTQEHVMCDKKSKKT